VKSVLSVYKIIPR